MKQLPKILFLILVTTLYAQEVDPLPVPAGYDLTPNPHVNVDKINRYIDFSDANRGLSKVIQIRPTIVYSQDLSWPDGAWGRGLFRDNDQWKNELFYRVNDCAQPLDGGGYVATHGYASSHPITHISSKMLRAHIHAANLYGQFGGTDNDDLVDNYQVIKDGLEYLINQQRSSGGYTSWWFRHGRDIPNLTDDPYPVVTDDMESACNNLSPEHSYQTSYALRAMTQGYHFLQSNDIPFDKMTQLYDAIINAADLLIDQIDLARDNDYYCWISNSNYKGLVAWALASAYKLTNNCKYLDGAMWVCNTLFIQNHAGGEADGTWETPYVEPNDTNTCNETIYHDTIIYYHAITLRGLIETFDALPNTSDFYYYKAYLVANINKGVNHIINKRILYNGNPGYYKKFYLTTDGNLTTDACNNVQHFISEDIIEPIATLALYARDAARHGTHYSAIEQVNLKNLLIVMGKPLHNENAGFFPTTATYADYFDAVDDFDTNTILRRIFPRTQDCTEADIISAGRSFPYGLPNDFDMRIGNNGSGIGLISISSLNGNNFIEDNGIISSKADDIIKELRLYDITGRKVYENTEVNGKRINIKTLDLKTGVYIVKIKNDSGEEKTRKVFLD